MSSISRRLNSDFINLEKVLIPIPITIQESELSNYLCGLHSHVLNVLCMQMRSRLFMQSSHVPYTTCLINKQINPGLSRKERLISHVVVNLFID